MINYSSVLATGCEIGTKLVMAMCVKVSGPDGKPEMNDEGWGELMGPFAPGTIEFNRAGTPFCTLGEHPLGLITMFGKVDEEQATVGWGLPNLQRHRRRVLEMHCEQDQQTVDIYYRA